CVFSPPAAPQPPPFSLHDALPISCSLSAPTTRPHSPANTSTTTSAPESFASSNAPGTARITATRAPRSLARSVQTRGRRPAPAINPTTCAKLPHPFVPRPPEGFPPETAALRDELHGEEGRQRRVGAPGQPFAPQRVDHGEAAASRPVGRKPRPKPRHLFAVALVRRAKERSELALFVGDHRAVHVSKRRKVERE